MELARVAELARLDLAPDELDALAGDVDRILAFVGQVARAPADADIDSGQGAPLREDTARSAANELLLAAAPALIDGLFFVPRGPE